jgi:hypothetical protein
VLTGACRVLELPELLDELEFEFEEFEFDALEEFEPPAELGPLEEPAEDKCFAEPRAAVPALEEPVPDDAPRDTPAVPDEWFGLVTAACVEPGSVKATAPAAATLAKPTVAVAWLRRRRPRSRSATARETLRAL